MKNAKWTQKEDKYLLENYLTQDIKTICTKLKRSESSITQRATVILKLKKSGSTKGIKNDDWIEKYKEFKSIRKVGRVFGVSHETARIKLKSLGVLDRTIRYTCNEEFFAQETPESFYWAGFITADGCVRLEQNKYKYLNIGLSSRDHEHLEYFKKAVGFNGPVHKTAIKTGGYKSEITIRSDKIFGDLERFGIIPRKSLIYTMPKYILGHKYLNHFLRGYVDGDGSFYMPALKNNRKVGQLYFSVRGTKEFLTDFKKVLERNCNVRKSNKKPRLNSNIYILEYGGNRVCSRIRDYLYSNSTINIRLERKYKAVYDKKFVDLPEDYRFKKVVGTNMVTGEQIILNSMKEGERYGFLRQGISACCRGQISCHKNYTWQYA